MSDYRNKGMGFFGFLFLFLFLVIVISGVLFYFDIISWSKFKTKIPLINKDEITVVTPPVEYDWCRIQDLSDSKIIGWDNENKCCVQEYVRLDVCLGKEIKIHRCFIGNVGTIHKWSKVDGYFTELPTDYSKFIDVSLSDCLNLIYPGPNQNLNIERNMVKI